MGIGVYSVDSFDRYRLTSRGRIILDNEKVGSPLWEALYFIDFFGLSPKSALEEARNRTGQDISITKLKGLAEYDPRSEYQIIDEIESSVSPSLRSRKPQSWARALKVYADIANQKDVSAKDLDWSIHFMRARLLEADMGPTYDSKLNQLQKSEYPKVRKDLGEAKTRSEKVIALDSAMGLVHQMGLDDSSLTKGIPRDIFQVLHRLATKE